MTQAHVRLRVASQSARSAAEARRTLCQIIRESAGFHAVLLQAV